MDKATFEAADKHVEEISEGLADLLEGEHFATVRKQLADLSRILGDDRSLSLSVGIEVFDEKRKECLPLLRTGLATNGGSLPRLVWGDSTPQKYIANGDMTMVPHDHCPSCWGSWDFKFRHRSCRSCGATLGVEVKVLLDTNRCPSCEKETVSPTELTCSECNFEIEPALVVWG